MKVSLSERAGEFGLAGEQRILGWFKEDRCFGDEKELLLVERSCAQVLALLRDQRRRQLNQLATLQQGTSLPIFRASMFSFYRGERANSVWQLRAWKFGTVSHFVENTDNG